jgi:hypothetical protein
LVEPDGATRGADIFGTDQPGPGAHVNDDNLVAEAVHFDESVV